MNSTRYLIVNADDFGQSEGVNRGIAMAHEEGILTSASLMVRWPHAEAAAHYALEHPALGVGLHLDFGEWVFRAGEWVQHYFVLDESDSNAVEREIGEQLTVYRRLMGRDPTHLDSHQHRHRNEPARSIVSRIAGESAIPVRSLDARVRHCGSFYGQDADGTPWADGITVDALARILDSIEPGYTEMGCHPAAAADLDTMYRSERLQELETLCDPRAKELIAARAIELCSFRRVVSGK